MAHNGLKSYYLRRQGYYYCAVARGTSEERAAFPFKHKRAAELLVLYRRRRTRGAWGVYRYGSRGAGEEYSTVLGIFSRTAPLAPGAAPLEILEGDDRPATRRPSVLHPRGGKAVPPVALAPPMSPESAASAADQAEWQRRAAVAEAVAAERASSLADMRATIALTQALLGVEPVQGKRPPPPEAVDPTEPAEDDEPAPPQPGPNWYEQRG